MFQILKNTSEFQNNSSIEGDTLSDHLLETQKNKQKTLKQKRQRKLVIKKRLKSRKKMKPNWRIWQKIILTEDEESSS